MSYQMFAQVMLKGYTALKSYGVDFQSLPEWKDTTDLDEARRLKPIPGQELTMKYLCRLENAIQAAINRRQNIRLHTDNTTPPKKH